MFRSVIAVVSGFVVVMVVVIAGTATAAALMIPGGMQAIANHAASPTPTYLAANLVVSVMAAVLGGWVAARMAPSRPMTHVYALAGLMVMMSLPSLLGYGDTVAMQPDWYRYLLPLVGVGGVLIGGRMRAHAGPPEPV